MYKGIQQGLAEMLEKLRAKAWASTRYKKGGGKSHEEHICWWASEKIEELMKAPHGHVQISVVREIFSRRLNLHYDQRAYSWHEIQNALQEVEESRKL